MPTPASELERLWPDRVLTAPEERALYARDMWALALARARRGDEFVLPSAVVRPRDTEDVSRLLSWCGQNGVAVIPSGGRSGVCGGVSVDAGALAGRDSVALDLTALRGDVVVAAEDLLAVGVPAGTPGPAYEQALAEHGLTGGHYPQSLAISTVGGWLACRSAGQFSTRYGRAEDMVHGLEVVLASGEVLSLGRHPASAAGPDLKRLFLGSEGTLGVITRATLRVVPVGELRPRVMRFGSFADGLDGIRQVIQQGLRPGVVRLYDPDDTAMAFPGQTGCVLVLVFTGTLAREEEAAVVSLLRGEDLGAEPGEHWLAHRFDAVRTYEEVMRPDGPLGPNVIVDTMEVASAWSDLAGLYASVGEALRPHALGVLCHASHVYPDGACLYFTFAVQGPDEGDSETRYHAAWSEAMDACLAAGGTITHHHGVGRLKAGWLRLELGDAGWGLLRTLKSGLDPDRILNPGNLGL